MGQVCVRHLARGLRVVWARSVSGEVIVIVIVIVLRHWGGGGGGTGSCTWAGGSVGWAGRDIPAPTLAPDLREQALDPHPRPRPGRGRVPNR